MITKTIQLTISDDERNEVLDHLKFRMSWVQAGMDEKSIIDIILNKVLIALDENSVSNKTWTMEYRGFESIMDFDEDWMDGLREITPDGEYTGTVKITMEYIPNENENSD